MCSFIVCCVDWFIWSCDGDQKFTEFLKLDWDIKVSFMPEFKG